jgi:NADH dehydrogenase
VRVLTNTKVQALQPDRLMTDQGEIRADLIVWAAGIKAAEANAGFGLATTKSNQFVVNERLETSAEGVYAFGDCAACPWVEGKLVPARAQAAHQQASFLVGTLKSLLHERAPSGRFVSAISARWCHWARTWASATHGRPGRPQLRRGPDRHGCMSLHPMHHRAISASAHLRAGAARLLRGVSGRLKLH